ncbi:MAG TPA: hypothetical protein VFQ38_22435 [Longimicrobiales bacterium]|nr:hypothetical protein [Longimicrobiales bacterium]
MLEISDILAKLGDEGVVDPDGGYLYWLKKEYKKYTRQQRHDIVDLERFLAELPNSQGPMYRVEIWKPQEFERYRTEMNRRLGEERARLWREFTAGLESGGIHCSRPFRQGDYTPNLQNKAGICFAASMDWLRRKMWNATRRDRKPMHEVWQAGRLEKRLAKLDGLQTVQKNFVIPEYTLQAYDRHRTAHHRNVDEGKAFGALLAGGARRGVENVDFDRDYSDCLDAVQEACLAVIGPSVEAVGADRPLGVLIELTESVARGHALALFRHGGPDGNRWSLFDPNHGEYMTKTAAVPAGVDLAARWYELYFGGSFVPTFTAVLPVA